MVIFPSGGKTQNNDISEEIRFVSYLLEISEYREAIFLINRIPAFYGNPEISQNDSLNYYAGRAFYQIKNLDSSAYFFDKVSERSLFYFSSKFYEAFDYIYQGKYELAKAVLNNIILVPDTDLIKLKNFQLAGIALLERDYLKFKEYSLGFDSGYYPAATEQQNFFQYHKNLMGIKLKSAFLAGIFSALIPGSGKFYAGYRGQAIAAFFPVALLAAVALESFFKAGLLSPQFIIFGGIFSVFYFGNIWGSALSVKTKNHEEYYELDHNITYDLYLPLQRVFN